MPHNMLLETFAREIFVADRTLALQSSPVMRDEGPAATV